MLQDIIHDIKATPYTVYQEFSSTRSGSYSSTGISQYEEFSYGFFSVICLAVALMVHINNYPQWYIQKSDYIIEILDSLWFSLGLIKEESYLPLYTPLNVIKMKNSKHVVINIPSLQFKKEITPNTVEDV